VTITASQAQPGDILLDSDGTAWKRGPELYMWATFAGPVGFYGPLPDRSGRCRAQVHDSPRSPLRRRGLTPGGGSRGRR